MAKLNQRIAALETVHQNQTRAGDDSQQMRDMKTAHGYWVAHDRDMDLLPPEYFSDGERKSLAALKDVQRLV